MISLIGRWITGLITGLLLLTQAPAWATDQSSPRNTVQTLQKTLLQVMKNAENSDFSERYNNLAPVIEKTHDLQRIARIAVGRYWKTMTPDQRQRYSQLFYELSIATYARQFNDYHDQRFIIDGTVPLGSQALVKTRLLQKNGKTIRLNYTVRLNRDQWRIVNVTFDGISDLALKRAQYVSIIRKGGINNLLTELNSKLRNEEIKR